MVRFNHRITRLAFSFGVSCLMLAGAAVPAFAGGSSEVKPGSLAITSTSSATFGGSSGVTLDGSNQDPTATINIGVKDDTGSGSGWKVTFAATQFTGANGHPLATNALSITGVNEADSGSGTYTAPDNSIEYEAAMVPGTSQVTIFDAAADTGMGHFQLTPAFKVHVPANTYADTYSSTFTVTVVSGPA